MQSGVCVNTGSSNTFKRHCRTSVNVQHSGCTLPAQDVASASEDAMPAAVTAQLLCWAPLNMCCLMFAWTVPQCALP